MRVVILILFMLALSLDVEAIAVASDYLNSNTLELVEGTSKIYKINLQNPDSYEVKYKVVYNGQFMKAIDFKGEYIMPSKSSKTIEFNVTAPKYDKNNDLFDISFTVHQLTGGGGGMGFLGKISKIIKLRVIKNPDRLHINYFYVVYAVILVTIVFFLYRKKNLKQKKKINWGRKFK